MAVKIGHASIDERGKAQGGSAGDQTGKEVCTRSWYNKPWICVIRPKSATHAEKIAKAMEQACANNKIGYDQYQRTTLYTQAKACGWDLSKITTACETDCSALVAVCVNAAGITVSKDIYTGNEKSALNATGKFEILTASKYLTSDAYLKRGDILLASGHTAIVLSNGSKAGASTGGGNSSGSASSSTKAEAAQDFDKSLAGTYKVTASALNIRAGAGTGKKSLGKIPNGKTVQCYGYYTKVGSVKWLYVTYNGITGFCSSEYLAKGSGSTSTASTPASSSTKAEAAQDFDKSLAGTYKVTASALNIRAGAGTGKKSLGKIPNGKTVQCYGYYTKVGSVKWLYVTYNGITGFCSSEYLKKA